MQIYKLSDRRITIQKSKERQIAQKRLPVEVIAHAESLDTTHNLEWTEARRIAGVSSKPNLGAGTKQKNNKSIRISKKQFFFDNEELYVRKQWWKTLTIQAVFC